MKTTGIVRKIDDFGRFVFPAELLRKLNIKAGDPLEIFVDEKRIYLKKHEPDCIFCGEADEAKEFKGKHICPECLKELKQIP